MKNLLIISVSDLRNDPRVSRQIELLKHDYNVITMGYGERPEGVRRHVRLPRPRPTTLAQKLRKVALSALGKHETTHLGFPGIAAAKDWLDAHGDQFDAVFVNDLSPLPVAVETGKPVHVDLHEYAMGQHPTLMWRFYQLPVLRWAARFLKDARSVSTVSPGIANLYQELGAKRPAIVTSGPRYRESTGVTPTERPIRLVHMGVAHEHRSLELYIEAVRRVNRQRPGALSLDMYLMPIKADYLRRLQEDAAQVGPAVSVRAPVPFEDMVDTLALYDVAVIFFPPTTPNLRHALPNKFFEAIQARIGVVIGPSEEMAPYVEEFGFGEIVPGWSLEDLTVTLAELTPGKVDALKQAANRAASELAAEKQDLIWQNQVAGLFERSSDD